jgi:hypothetical protein
VVLNNRRESPKNQFDRNVLTRRDLASAPPLDRKNQPIRRHIYLALQKRPSQEGILLNLGNHIAHDAFSARVVSILVLGAVVSPSQLPILVSILVLYHR